MREISEAYRDIIGALVGTPRDPNERPLWAEASPWWQVYSRCESPIERQMCVAFKEGLDALPGDGDYTFEKLEAIAKAQPSGAATVVYPQQNILTYRVDFLIVHYDSKADNFRRLIVECDGHDYHMGNYQALIRDRRRDAELQRHRYPMFRFTGSQIFRAAPELVKRIWIDLMGFER